MKVLGVAIFFLFFGQELFAQTSAENFRSIFFKKKNGGQIVFSGNIHSITIDIDSVEIKSTDKPSSIIVGNKMLQYELAADTVLYKSMDPKDHLMAFLKNRLSYAKHQLKQHYTNAGHQWQLIDNKTWLVWYYDLPGEYGSLLKQINLSTVCFSHILNITVFSNDGDKTLLTEIAQTLKQNDFTINFDKQFKALSDLRSF